ncbi:hypothetical protein AJ78_06703 [Emergomyces pasteurianus Ep9510]|uniref:Uncharacterized protein n=1 Tax=Emergomyces pasteurianus Ep9510 TaxID=1447872 RepID=A0A1J9P7Y3_9EURO|nr:hypothetical protein AJ78_06703 [Emergomyces pasteurianus Ep9510]
MSASPRLRIKGPSKNLRSLFRTLQNSTNHTEANMEPTREQAQVGHSSPHRPAPPTPPVGSSDRRTPGPPPSGAHGKRRREDPSENATDEAPPTAKRRSEKKKTAPKSIACPVSSESSNSKIQTGSTNPRKPVENVDLARLAQMRSRKNEKKEIDPDVAAQYSQAYQEAWLSGKPEKLDNIHQQLEAHFFGQEGYLPRCYTCRKSGVSLPEPKAPKDAGPYDVLPCGCTYSDAMLEMWLVRKGLWKKWKNIPKTIGKHRAIMIGFFEMLFGEFSVDKLLNIGNARVVACQRMGAKEDATSSRLAPCEID